MDETNEYTKDIDKYTTRKDFFKFMNVILNSSHIKGFLSSNNLNTLSLEKIRNIVLFPKINFEETNDINTYNELVDIANQFISLENETKITI